MTNLQQNTTRLYPSCFLFWSSLQSLEVYFVSIILCTEEEWGLNNCMHEANELPFLGMENRKHAWNTRASTGWVLEEKYRKDQLLPILAVPWAYIKSEGAQCFHEWYYPLMITSIRVTTIIWVGRTFISLPSMYIRCASTLQRVELHDSPVSTLNSSKRHSSITRRDGQTNYKHHLDIHHIQTSDIPSIRLTIKSRSQPLPTNTRLCGTLLCYRQNKGNYPASPRLVYRTPTK